MNQTYLITGAAGHLGFAVVQDLLFRNLKVRALVLPNDKTADRLPQAVERIEGDLLQGEDIDRFFAGIEPRSCTVIHCAGIVSTSSKFSQVLHDVNVGGTRRLVDKCRQLGVRKLVYVSSVHAIPLIPHGKAMSEPDHTDPDLVVGPYAKSKAEATEYVRQAALSGLDASIVYPGGIIGPWDHGRGHVTELIIDFYEGRLPMGICGGYDFVDVRDVAAGVIACAERGKKGEGYILANRVVSVREFLDLLHTLTGKRQTRSFVPVWFVRLILPLCGLWYRLRGQPPMFNKYSLYTLTGNSEFSHEKASRELGYTTRSFEVSVRDTVQWLLAEKRM